MAAGPVNGSCTRLGSVAGDYGCRTDARFIEKHAPISLMSLPSRAPENEFFHNDFQSSAGLGRGCNPARGCSRRGANWYGFIPSHHIFLGGGCGLLDAWLPVHITSAVTRVLRFAVRGERGRTSGTRRFLLRDEPSILRPDPIRWERQGESHVGSVLWISPFEEATGLSKFVNVVCLLMLGNMSPKDSQGFLKGVRGLAAPPCEFVAMGFYLVEQILGHMQIVPAQDDETPRHGVAQQGRDQDVRVDHKLQGPSPGPRGPPLPMLFPDAVFHGRGNILDVLVGELARAEQRIEPTQ